MEQILHTCDRCEGTAVTKITKGMGRGSRDYWFRPQGWTNITRNGSSGSRDYVICQECSASFDNWIEGTPWLAENGDLNAGVLIISLVDTEKENQSDAKD